MSYKKCAILTLIFIFSTIGLTIIYGKFKLKHIDYSLYEENSDYFYFQKKFFVEAYPDILNYIIDDKEIDNIDSLISFSDYIVVAQVKDYLLYGDGIINICEIKNIIKGDNLKTGENIPVYDLTAHWNLSISGYLEGSTPLKKNEIYIMFLKKTGDNSLNKDAFVFSSIKYGHINTLNSKYLTDYEQYSKKVNEIKNYDYIFTGDFTDDDINKYNQIKLEIIEFVQKETEISLR